MEEEIITVKAASRYRKVVDGYKSKLRENSYLKLSDYCKECHTNYIGVVDWAKRHEISILELRREAK